jgi:hypothetical protein
MKGFENYKHFLSGAQVVPIGKAQPVGFVSLM